MRTEARAVDAASIEQQGCIAWSGGSQYAKKTGSYGVSVPLRLLLLTQLGHQVGESCSYWQLWGGEGPDHKGGSGEAAREADHELPPVDGGARLAGAQLFVVYHFHFGSLPKSRQKSFRS